MSCLSCSLYLHGQTYEKYKLIQYIGMASRYEYDYYTWYSNIHQVNNNNKKKEKVK